MTVSRLWNGHFIYACYRVAWIIPLLGGVRGGFLSPFPVFTRTSFTRTRVVKSQWTPLESLEEASNPSHTVFSQNSALSDGDSFLTGWISHEVTDLPTPYPLVNGDEGGCNSAFSAPFAVNYYVITMVKRFLDALEMTVLLVFVQALYKSLHLQKKIDIVIFVSESKRRYRRLRWQQITTISVIEPMRNRVN